MAGKPQIKANQLAKDFNVKSKDIVDAMTARGIELKAQKSLEPYEFAVLFDALTSAHQIEGIDDYIDGITYIPSKLGAADGKAADKRSDAKTDTEASREAKSEAKPETVQEKPVNEAPAQAQESIEKTNDQKHEPKNNTNKAEQTPTVRETAAEPQIKEPVKVQPKVDRAEAIARAAAIERAAREKAMQRSNAASEQRQRTDNSVKRCEPFDKQHSNDRRPFNGQSAVGTQKPQSRPNDRFSSMGTPNFDRQSAPQRRDDRRNQKPQFNNQQGRGMDKEDFVQSAPEKSSSLR